MLRLGDVAFLSGTLGFLSVALLLLVPQMLNKPQESKLQFTNLDVSCWTPVQFAAPWVVYAQRICKSNLLNNQSYKVFVDGVPRTSEPEVFSIYDELEALEERTDEKSVFDVSSKQSVLVLVVFEVLFIFAFYSLFLIGHQGDSAICRIVSTVGHVVGILFFLLAAFIPYLSLANVLEPLLKGAQEKNGIFLCDFGVRNLGNVQRYSVQCAYSMSISAPHTTNVGNMEPYLNLNGIVCGAVVIAIIGSFVATLIPKKDQSSKN